MPDPAQLKRDDVVAVLAGRYRAVDALRRGSGGSVEDPYSGGEWYRAQLVAIRDVAHGLGVYNDMHAALDQKQAESED